MTQIGENYIANLNLKKRKVGGVDAIDAINHLDALSKAYEQYIAGREQYFVQTMGEMDTSLKKAYAEINTMRSQVEQAQAAVQQANQAQAAAQQQIKQVQAAAQQLSASQATQRPDAQLESYLQNILYLLQRIEQRIPSQSYTYPN